MTIPSSPSTLSKRTLTLGAAINSATHHDRDDRAPHATSTAAHPKVTEAAPKTTKPAESPASIALHAEQVKAKKQLTAASFKSGPIYIKRPC